MLLPPIRNGAELIGHILGKAPCAGCPVAPPGGWNGEGSCRECPYKAADLESYQQRREKK